MKYLVIFLVLAGLFTNSAFAFEPSYTNYFSNPEFKIYKVQENAYEFSIPYKISDAKLDRIVVDCDSTALIIYLDAVGTEGNLIINIPRALLDAKINDQDDALFFILDQQEVEPPEINTDSDSRTFDIPLQTDGEILEIIAEIVGVYPEPNPCGVGGDDKSPYYRLLSPLKQSQSGIPFNEIQCKQNLVLIQKYDGSPACVTESTKQKLIERGWTGITIVLNDNQREIGSYLKQAEILDENYARMSMSYPTNDAKHEIYPDDYQSIVSGCTEQNNTATLSLLYLQKIDTGQNQMTFRQENKTFDGLQCDEAFWQEMTEWGYCGPPHPLIFNTESLASSITEAQNRTDLMLDLPQYLPSGYSIQKITVEPDGDSTMLYISQKPVTNETPVCEFTWNDEGIFLFYSKPPENFDWDKKYAKYAEDPKKQLVTINDNSGYVEDRWVGDRFGMPIPQQSKVVWYINENDEIIEIHSSLSGEELIKIAESFQ